MADYRIDVHRGTVTITGSFSGKMRANITTADVLVEECEDATAAAVETVNVYSFPWGGLLRVDEHRLGTGMSSSDPVEFGIILTAESGFGDTDTAHIFTVVQPAASGIPTGDYGTDVTAVYSGTIEVTFQLETLMTPTVGGMPIYGGAESIDSPPQTDMTLYERFVPGTLVSVEICAEVAFSVDSAVSQPDFVASGSGCASASDTLSGDVSFSDYELGETAQVVTAQNDSASVITSVDDWLGENSRPTLTCTASAGGATATATVNSLSASVSVSVGGADVCQNGYGSATNNIAPDRKFNISGMIRRMEHAYPDAVVEVWDGAAYQELTADSDGRFDYEGTQSLYSGSVSAHAGDGSIFESDDCSDSDSENEWGGVWVRLKPSWKTDEDIELPLWPVLFRAFPAYDVFDLEQASERDVLSAYSGTGPSDISRTISLANGADTDLDGTDWSGFSLRGYAYLTLRLKADAVGSPFAVTIGSKTWTKDRTGSNLIAGTSFADFVIDLLCPDGGETDDKDSRYPYTSSGPIVVNDSDLFGVSNATTIVLTNLASTDYDVDSVKLSRLDHSYATVVHGFNHFVPAVVGDTSQYQVRFLELETDGCRTHEHIALVYNTVTEIYTHRTIADIVESINGASGAQPADGWSATAEVFDLSGCAPSSPDKPNLSPCWLNDERYAAWIEGSGAKYSGGAWAYGFDLDCASSRTFQAQMMFHRLLSWPPGLDDPLLLSSGSVGGAVFLPCASILRAQGVGVVHHESGVRASSVTVEIDGGAQGSGTTDAYGIYQTGIPYPPGSQTFDVVADVGEEPPSLSTAFYSRTRSRGAFRVVLIEGVVLYYVYQDRLGQLHAIGTDTGNIRYFRSNSSLPIPNWAVNGVYVTGDAETEGEDEHPVVVRNWQHRLFSLFDRPDEDDPMIRSVYECVSDDDGETWSEPERVFEGASMPFNRVDSNGNHIDTAYSGGNITARFRAAGDETWSDLFLFTDSMGNPLEVEEECYSFDDAHDRAGLWVLSVVIAGESSSSLWWSADEGRESMSWTRVT